MTLGELIERLEKEPDKEIRFGFGNPHSFRGYYEQLAFEPMENASVAEMLSAAKYALGKTFCGYKGGEFTMYESTECWISFEGTSYDSENIGRRFLEMILTGDCQDWMEAKP